MLKKIFVINFCCQGPGLPGFMVIGRRGEQEAQLCEAAAGREGGLGAE